MTKYIFAFAFLSFAFFAEAQQSIQYTQFMFNKLQFNPAYAGTKGHFALAAFYRKQWLGIQRAPQSATFNAHGSVLNKRLGLGLSLSYDQIGFSNRVSIETNYSYIIRFKDRSFLSLGLRGSAYYNQIRWEEADMIDQFDAAIPQSSTSTILPNFGAGVYYQARQWYVGLSVPHIFRNQGDFNITANGIVEPEFTQHYFLTGGFMFRIAKNIDIQQNLLLKYVVNAPLSTDINLSLVFFDKILFGLTYRIGDSMDAILQWQISNRLRIAVAYDFSVSAIQQYNSGSIEAMIGYQFAPPGEPEELPVDFEEGGEDTEAEKRKKDNNVYNNRFF
jgi:type IX secretion system PorP/SprF family membrane protein